MRQSSSRKTGELLATLIVLACASVSPLILTASAAGYSTMHELAIEALVPALVVWIGIALATALARWERLSRGLVAGLLAGVAGTIGLEAVRILGFRVFHAMPGSLPELIGVLITDRFMQGPNAWSNVLGWGDHFVTGIGFATIFVLVFGRPRAWTATPYGLAIAVVFLGSPVVRVTGAGYFGKDFGPGFATTVLLAHLVFGAVIGVVIAHSAAVRKPIWRLALTGPGPEKEVPMKVQLFYFPGCPHADATRVLLRRVLAEEGLPAAFEEIDVSAAATPEELRPWGSPTVLVDGHDIAGLAPTGSSCRLYRTAGGTQGVPPEDLLREALRRAR